MTDSPRNQEAQSNRLGLREWLGAGVVSLATAVAILAPFFWLGSASGHDIQFHISSWLDAAGQWKEGILYPRWTEWANYGFGEPRFIFYPPLSWMLGAALGSVLPWTWIPPIFVLLVQTIAGISAYTFLRRIVSSFSAALLGAVAYTANPYALLVIYVRSDYAELLATSLYPLLLLFALHMCGYLKNDAPARKNLVWFSVLFSAVWLSNAPAGVLASYSLAFLFIVTAIAQTRLQPALRGAGGLALGLGLAAFYLVPAAYEQRWVNIKTALSVGLAPAENFLFINTRDAEHDAFNQIASYIAVLMMACVIAAAIGFWQENRKKENIDAGRRVFPVVIALAIAASLMMTRATGLLWAYLPKLRFVQFPWRWMAVLAVAFSLLTALVAKRRVLVFSIGLAIVAAGTGTYLVRHTWWDSEDVNAVKAAVDSGAGFEGTDEYDPLGDDHTDIPQKQPIVKLLLEEDDDGARGKIDLRIVRWTAEERIVSVKSDSPVKVRLRLLRHPAWMVTMNGKPITSGRTRLYNAIVVSVPPGESLIEAKFIRTTDRIIGDWLSVLALVIVLALGWYPRRNTR